MKSCIGIFIGLLLSVSVSAESLLEGRVRLASGGAGRRRANSSL